MGEAHCDLGEFSESEVTNALLRLSHGEGRRIYFFEKHNERLRMLQAVSDFWRWHSLV